MKNKSNLVLFSILFLCFMLIPGINAKGEKHYQQCLFLVIINNNTLFKAGKMSIVIYLFHMICIGRLKKFRYPGNRFSMVQAVFLLCNTQCFIAQIPYLPINALFLHKIKTLDFEIFRFKSQYSSFKCIRRYRYFWCNADSGKSISPYYVGARCRWHSPNRNR